MAATVSLLRLGGMSAVPHSGNVFALTMSGEHGENEAQDVV
jgi:hypothetical protein